MRTLDMRVFVALTLGWTLVAAAKAQDRDSAPPFPPYQRPVELAQPDPLAEQPSRTTARLKDDVEIEEMDSEAEMEEESGFRWPSLPKPKLPSLPKLSLPTWTTAREMPDERAERAERMRAAEEPSAWEKFNSGTKSMLTKTKQTLMPWTQEETTSAARRPVQPPRRTPPRTASRTRPKPTEKKSFFPWFNQQEEEKPVETVNDFLSQPRVR